MTSDILILLKQPATEQDASVICGAIYKVTTTAVVNFEASRAKVILVKFDPDIDVPGDILNAVLATGREAVMTGG